MTRPMMRLSLRNRIQSVILALTVIGMCFHLINVAWGQPFYFHPDERNIASAVSQLSFPASLNPRFFAYGSLPIYTIYFLQLVPNSLTSCALHLTNCHVSFEQAIILSRLISAFLATLLIPMMYLLGRTLNGEETGLVSAFLTTFSTGLIQFAHFGTFELWLTFFTTLLFYVCLGFITHPHKRTLVLMGVVSGILLAIKISSLILLILPVLAIGLAQWQRRKGMLQKTAALLPNLTAWGLLVIAVFMATNPYTFLDWQSFLGSMQYESAVALGRQPVFYTGEFYDTLPILFQLRHVFPFLLNPLVTILILPALSIYFVLVWRKKNNAYLLLLSFLAATLLSQAFLFVKWTRYMVPTLPFLYLILGVSWGEFSKHFRNTPSLTRSMLLLFGGITVLFASSYSIIAFLQPDTRTAAATWAQQHLPQDAAIVSEVYDLGIVPFNQYFPKITLFNFYDLDAPGTTSGEQLRSLLAESDYLILPSQRIFKSRLARPRQFPKGYAFYQSLLHNSATYQKIYETPCNLFCQITYLTRPVDAYEQTAHVFDRPEVMIFKIYHE